MTSEYVTQTLNSIQEAFKRISDVFNRKRLLGTIAHAFRLKYRITNNNQLVQKAKYFECSHCHLRTPAVGEFFIFLSCGHLLCKNCGDDWQHGSKMNSSYAGQLCIATDSLTGSTICFQYNRNALTLLQDLLHAPFGATKFNPTHPSPKVQAIIDTIKQLPQDERILVFVQYNTLKDEICDALQRNNIAYTRTDGAKSSKDSDETRLQAFKDGKYRVLLMSPMTAESAGANLETANHIFFAAPLVTDRLNWSMYMRQAKGRCIRYNQMRSVEVRHFVTENTLEVDLLETRLGRTFYDAGGNGGGSDMLMEKYLASKPPLTPFGERTKFYAQAQWPMSQTGRRLGTHIDERDSAALQSMLDPEPLLAGVDEVEEGVGGEDGGQDE
jgi:SNF2 family DNA or RNA helicase